MSRKVHSQRPKLVDPAQLHGGEPQTDLAGRQPLDGLPSPASTSKFRLDSKTVQCIIIIVLGALLYANSLQVPFYLDDYREIVNSQIIKSFSYFINYHSSGGIGSLISRSFGYLTFLLNYQIGGLNVVGYHLVNSAIHIISALLVYRIVSLTLLTPYFADGRDKKTAGNRAGFIAFFAALLFVAHPLQTQAVTYIIQRFASLAALLYMLSLSCYIRARLITNEPGKSNFACLAWFTAAIVSGLLALMTKQNAFTLPLMVILFEMMFFPGDIKKKIRNLGILFAAAVAGVAIIIAASGKPVSVLFASLDRATTVEPDITRLDYLATQMRVLVTYLRLLIFPAGQQLDYSYAISSGFLNTDVLLSGALLCALFLAAVYCLLLSRRKESRYGDAAQLFRIIAFGIFWFFITMLIESSIIPITDVIFEHRMYLPSAGIFMAAAASVSLLGGAGNRVPGWPRPRVLAASAAVILILGFLTIARNQVWRDEISFWEDNASKSPRNGRVLNNLAQARERKGDLKGAEEAYVRAINLKSYQAASFINLGHIYIEWGRLDKALELYRIALSIDPGIAEAHEGIGIIYKNQNKNEEALQEFLQAINLKPALQTSYANIALIYCRLNKNTEALEYFGKAIELNPDDVSAYVNRGQLFLITGRKNEAIDDYRRALMIDPNNATAAAQLRWLTGGR